MASLPASRNRTILLSPEEIEFYSARLLTLDGPVAPSALESRTVHQDVLQILGWLPQSFVDLLVVDPPYNLAKRFGATSYAARPRHEYAAWFESWFALLVPCLKPTASVYVCGDWRSSGVLEDVLGKYLIVRNRITWEREKGRGATRSWKNCSEDIWFSTMSDEYVFNVNHVKLRRRVIAPYTTDAGTPKDWIIDERDGPYRLTHPSNVWTDLTVPFWSMPENTDHPTQKPEKLLAKIILASSNPSDLVLDPFVGSGTTAVVAKKLRRRWVGVDVDLRYCCLTEKRLELAASDPEIQGYEGGVFWERNSLSRRKNRSRPPEEKLFELRHTASSRS